MKVKQYKLKKELGLFQATLYGVGIILGAGIYVLLGTGAGIAGNAIWLSFAIAALIAAFTGMSYAELSSMYSKDAAEYVYTKNAFRKPAFSFIVEWIMMFAVIVSGATVALGFGGYFSHIFGVPQIAAAVSLIVVLSLISYIGIRLSAEFNIVSTLIEMSGLVIVAAIGLFFIGKGGIDYFYTPSGMAGIFSATAVIFFAYIGFEELVNFSEETKNAKKIMPRALLLSLAISTILYMLVAVSAVSIVGWERLSTSKAPLTEVISSVYPNAAIIMSIIALFATSNTVLVILIVASRLLYGLSCNHSLPGICRRVGSRGTPYVSVFLVMILSILALTAGGIKEIAMLTDIGIFIVYVFINASLIALRYTQPKAKRLFRSPINIGKFPVLALFGIIASSFMLLHFSMYLLLLELTVIAIGSAVYLAFTRKA